MLISDKQDQRSSDNGINETFFAAQSHKGLHNII